MSDIEEAQAGLDFAKRFEIIKGSETKNIKLQAVDLSDESAITDALPRYLPPSCHSCMQDCGELQPSTSWHTVPLHVPKSNKV